MDKTLWLTFLGPPCIACVLIDWNERLAPCLTLPISIISTVLPRTLSSLICHAADDWLTDHPQGGGGRRACNSVCVWSGLDIDLMGMNCHCIPADARLILQYHRLPYLPLPRSKSIPPSPTLFPAPAAAAAAAAVWCCYCLLARMRVTTVCSLAVLCLSTTCTGWLFILLGHKFLIIVLIPVLSWTVFTRVGTRVFNQPSRTSTWS